MVTLHEACDFASGALAAEPSLRKVLILAPDGIRYSSGRLRVFHPVRLPVSRAVEVDAAGFLATVSRLGKDCTLEESVGGVRVKRGRSRVEFRIAEAEGFDIDSGGKWQSLSADACQLVALLFPFISENATHIWASGLILSEGLAIGANNTIFAWGDGAGFNATTAILPFFVLKFLQSCASAPTKVRWEEGAVSFAWVNGAFVKSPLVQGEPPRQVFDLIKSWSMADGFEVTQELRETIALAAKLEAVVLQFKDGFTKGVFGQGEIDGELAVPDGAYSVKVLGLASSVAARFSFAGYPRNGTFEGPVLRGLFSASNGG